MIMRVLQLLKPIPAGCLRLLWKTRSLDRLFPPRQRRRAMLAGLVLGLLPWLATPALAQEQTWRINVKNADLNEFVMQVAEITGKTFVVDPRIKGNVTVVSSTPMTRDAVYELFLSVLRVHNWTAVPSGGVIRIQQNATAKQSPGAEGDLSGVAPEELVTRVVAAQNVDSAELVKILRPLIPQYGHIAAVANPNVVIISDHADNILRLVRLVQQIDVSDEDQVIVVPLRDAWVGNVVALLEKVAPDQLAAGAVGPQRVQLIANERNNSLVVRGKPRPVAEILKLVEQLDQPATTSGATSVIYLKHGDASKLAPMLEEMIASKTGDGEQGRATTAIRADESLNAIVVRGDPAVMADSARSWTSSMCAAPRYSSKQRSSRSPSTTRRRSVLKWPVSTGTDPPFRSSTRPWMAWFHR
jgi:general secretion pathway protein D